MTERLSFDVVLTEPEPGDDEWEARFKDFAGYGESAEAALASLGVQIGEVMEDTEYNRVHAATGVPEHGADSPISEVQRLDNPEVPQGEGGQDRAPIHPAHPPEDRV